MTVAGPESLNFVVMGTDRQGLTGSSLWIQGRHRNSNFHPEEIT